MSSTFRMSAGASRRIMQRMLELRFEPAVFEGKPIEVFVLFSAIAQKSADCEIVTCLLTNHLY